MKNGFQQTEIGRFPVEWDITTIDDAFTLQQGKSLSNREQTGEFRKPFLRTANVFWGRLNLSKVDEMDIPPKDRERLGLRYGDVLVCEGGDIGRTAMWRRELSECYYQNHLHRLRRKDDRICPEFFVLWMEAAFQFLNLYGGVGNRTTIPNLSSSRLKEFQFPLPPPPEQRKIAAVLARIHRAVELQEAILANLRELKKSLMNRLFTHGLRGEKLKQTEIGRMPVSWEMKPLKDAVEITYGIQAAVAHNFDPSIGLPILTNINITSDGKIDTSLLRYFKLRKRDADKVLRKGDILFNWRSGSVHHVGKTAIFDLDDDYTFSSFILRLRTNGKDNNLYLFYFLTWLRAEKYFENKSLYLVNAKFNASEASRIPTALPEPDEQQEIANILNSLDDKLAVHESKKTALQDLFKTTLNQLMTGAVRVADLDIDTSEYERLEKG